MILSAGLSPAWQHTLVFDTLRVDQVNRAREAHWCASGKVINAARAVHRLAAHDGGALPGLALTVLGGSTGDATLAALSAEGLDTAIVRTQTATRVCTTVIGRTEGSVTELVEEAGALTPEELDAFRTRFRMEAARAKAVVLTGSLPTGTPPDFFRTLIEGIAAPVVLDVRGPELLVVLPLKPFLVKPNREELARTVGHSIVGEAALRAAMHEVARQGAAWVVVSQGGDAVWVLGDGRFYRIRPLAVETVNPIGSGDCLAAGIAYGTARGLPPLEAIRLGIAAAADNVASLLPGHIDPASVQRRRALITLETF
jgi:1-phosphofructokinase family hexose kinase